jgi:hypothetical protein
MGSLQDARNLQLERTTVHRQRRKMRAILQRRRCRFAPAPPRKGKHPAKGRSAAEATDLNKIVNNCLIF